MDLLTQLFLIEGHVWFLAVISILCGFLLAWWVFRPGPDGRGSGLVSQLGLYRSLTGTLFVLALCYPYRTTTDSLDDMLGKFNISVLVASGVMGLSFLVLWGLTLGVTGDGSRGAVGRVVERFVMAVLGFGAWVFASVQLSGDGPIHPEPGYEVWPLLWLLTTTFYFAACYFIARYWFGVNEVHPQLGPAATALTVIVMTGRELFFQGPEKLPVDLWLPINAAGLGTTLSLCVWEFLETTVERRAGPRWLPAAAAAVGGLVTAALLVAVSTGTVQRRLCGGGDLRCESAVAPGPAPDRESVSFTVSLGQNQGVDLDARLPGVRSAGDGGAVDLLYDNSYAMGFVVHPGNAYAAVWGSGGSPGHDDCARVVRRPVLGSRGVSPRAGLMLCVRTGVGHVALLRVDDASYAVIDFSGVLWR